MAVRRRGIGGGLSAAVDRLSAHAQEWGAARVLDEGLDLLRDSTWADASMLLEVDPHRATVLARRPGEDGPMAAVPRTLPADWFPWGLAPVNPRRFLLVEDATWLRADPDSPTTLGDLGIRSCLHLPILERSVPVGAAHLYWSEPRLAWDDDQGRILRTLGRFLLSTARPEPPQVFDDTSR